MMASKSDKQIVCDRYWLLTWTMYGNWLPGDKRGFVSNVRDGDGAEVRHNVPGTQYDSNIPALENHARKRMKGDPVRINVSQAETLFAQFQQTSRFRGWRLFAAAIMANHCHLVVGAPADPEPATLLQSFKGYGSRVLNNGWERPQNGTWWTGSGSTRKLPDDVAVFAAIQYISDQEFPLLIWTTNVPELNLEGGRIK
jgi:REP element-mobilizing transposase RayT